MATRWSTLVQLQLQALTALKDAGRDIQSLQSRSSAAAASAVKTLLRELRIFQLPS